VTGQVLRRWGGEYEALAERLEQGGGGVPPEPIFPALKTLDFVTALLVESMEEPAENWPPIETETFIITTIQVAAIEATPVLDAGLQPFTFQTATVEMSCHWTIKTQPQQAWQYIEALNHDVELAMVEIPGGEFLMGSPQDEIKRQDNEGPQHLVQVSSFFMGRYPITQAQWRVVADTMPQVKQSLSFAPSRFKGDTLPVERVSWFDAVEFCARLSVQTKREYRLPSEAEWEYACRAGTTTPFYYGHTIMPELANYDYKYVYNIGPKGESPGQTSQVGAYYPNAWGLSDMHGNVWEWCADYWHGDYNYDPYDPTAKYWHGNYNDAPTDGRAWLNNSDEMTNRRVFRGGSWSYNPQYCRSACRNYLIAHNANRNIGFRVVLCAPNSF
jgi:formylglycine-generating enzyme required for sulfatase activity